jgi:putative ABC transport system permease protein
MADDGTDTTSYAMFSSISSKFYVKYENIDSFTEGVKNLGISDFYKINTNEHEITSSLEPIKSISNFSLTFLFVILIVGAVVLTIINLFNIRERKYEIGVLRAIGMSKIKVTMQLVSEIFAVALVTLIIGTSVGTALAQPVSNYMLSSEIKSYQNKQDDIRKNFGGQGFARSGFSGNSSESRTNYRNNNTNSNTESYVTSLKVHTDFTTIIELFGVSLILTIISGVTAVTFVNKYEPNRILQNRG